MAWFIGQSAVMIGLAFALGVLVGWMVWHRRPVSAVDGVAAAGVTAARTSADGAGADGRRTAAATGVPTGAATEAATARAAATVAAQSTPESEADSSATDRTDEIAAIWDGMKRAGKSHRNPVTAVPVTPRPDVDQPPLPPIDDLARIEGIGPKIASALVEAGIRTYEQLAATDLSTLQAATRAAKITFTPSVNSWPQQAALLAAGDENGFNALTDRLIAGREPVQRTPDDLARIEGIGPKITAALLGAGIRTYRQVADAEVSTLEAAIDAAGITFAPSIVTWSAQAKLLAAGDEDGFAELTRRLVAGREEAARA